MSEASEKSARYIFLFWPEGSRSVALPDVGSLTIGRASTCDVAINHESVSRVHAAIHSDRGAVSIEDLASSNGTRIMGKKLPPSTRIPIEEGTLVELGLVTLVVQGSESIGVREDKDIPTPPRTIPVAPIDASSMDRLDELVALVSKSRVSVLILGEKGTGKEMMAEQIHRESPRKNAALVKVYCGAASESDLAAELFGTQEKAGALESARGGTVFLDDVSALPIAIQATLLHALEEGEVTRVGATKPKEIDARILSATHDDLAKKIAEGTFRRALYDRLNGISLTVPALRDRQSEIPELVEQLVQDTCKARGIPALQVTALALADLGTRAWPRNIRELRGVIELAVDRANRASARSIDVDHVRQK